MNLRAFRRAVALGLAFALSLLRLGLIRLRGRLTMEQRAVWLQSCGRVVMASLGIRCKITGAPPERGLLVANHLSYLDIVIFAAALPCFFVGKAEIDGWPLFGWMARVSGTIFVDRSSHESALTVMGQVAERIKGTIPVLVFPEGTSTDGRRLLRFHSRLFHPSAVDGAPVTAAAIRYVIEDGSPERDLCWFGDTLFLPSLWKALGTAGFTAELTFGEPRAYPDRRTAADRTHAEIEAMRGQGAPVEA